MFTDPCAHRCKYMIVYTKAYKHIDIHTCTRADRHTCVDDNIHGLDYMFAYADTYTYTYT